MDHLNRLTRNVEWEVGARYRYTMGKPWPRRLHEPPPREATFLGWANGGRMVGCVELQEAEGTKIVCAPCVWRNRWVLVQTSGQGESRGGDETLEVPGPVINGKPRAARIEIKRNRATGRVTWDVGGIDVNGATSDAFARRLEDAGMHRALHRWVEEHRAAGKPRPWFFGGVRWGHVRGVPVEHVGDLAELVAGFYRAAVVDLPLTYPTEKAAR